MAARPAQVLGIQRVRTIFILIDFFLVLIEKVP